MKRLYWTTYSPTCHQQLYRETGSPLNHKKARVDHPPGFHGCLD